MDDMNNIRRNNKDNIKMPHQRILRVNNSEYLYKKKDQNTIKKQNI